MNIKETKQVILIALKAGLVPMLWGPPGIGKTSVVEQLAIDFQKHYLKQDSDFDESQYCFDPENKAFRLSMLTGSTAMLDDLTGIPKLNDLDNNSMIWARPETMLKIDDTGIIFIDEITDAISLSISKGFYTIVLDHRSKTHKISKKVKIIAAGNRPQDGSGSNMLPSALITRMLHIGVCCEIPDFTRYLPESADIDILQWIEYAASVKFHPLVIGFIKSFPEYIYKYQSIPRTLEFASKILSVYSNPDSILFNTLTGVLGKESGNKLFGYVKKSSKMPSIDSIIQDPVNSIVPADMDIVNMVSYELVNKADKNNISNIVKYARRLDQEHCNYMLLTIENIKPELIVNQEMIQWRYDNADILS